ncbi:MAG: DNA polymerase I [Deltaproteobacteria bacterium]|nr:DNA polymerase I [Deltaproteobacteria bacterium]
MEEDKKIYLIDGSAYIYRAYHAIRELSNSKGLPTNAVFGFTKMLLKLIEEKSPKYLGMFFDAKGPTFRHEMFEAYKANRPPMPDDLSVQIPFIKDVVRGFNLHVMELEGFEADDLIGTFARIAEAKGFSVVMVTGDKDFMQLVTDKTSIWDPMKDKIIDADTIKNTYNLKPSQLIDVMGLSGDKADNVPGVPGIGEKTALGLIQTYGNIDTLYEKVDEISKKKQRENLIQFKDQAMLSKSLVTIDTDSPISFNVEDFTLKQPDQDRLFQLFKELEFRQLLETFSTADDLSNKTYTGVFDTEDLSTLVNRLESSEVFAIDTETTSKNPMEAKLVGLSFSINPDEAYYIPCGHNYLGAPKQLELDYTLDTLKPVLENPKIKKIGQNIKYDWIVLKRHGVHLSGVAFDTMLESYLINPSKRTHSLDQIAINLLGHKMISYEDVAGKGKKAIEFSKVPIDKAVPYACEDADITLIAHKHLEPMIKKEGLSKLLETVEMPLVPVLMDMEMRGIVVDKDRLRENSASFGNQLEQLEKEIYSLAGEEFNINSSQQLGRILFDKLELPVQKKTKKKTGYSTDVEVLKNLQDYHELPKNLLRYRTLAKLKSTYTDSLLELVNEETGRVHTSFNQTVTATGRLSSSGPNLQNIPIRTEESREIRKAFVPQKGWRLVSVDYSQIELRIFAHYSEDKTLLKAFMEDEDIHTRTAIDVFESDPSLVSTELRDRAKTINFGIIYGMSAFGLSKALGISRQMAQTFIDHYFERYSGVKRFIEKTIEEAKKEKKVTTLLGRIRQLPDIDSSNKNVREFAERTAVNTPIQGTAADLIKVAMIKIDNEFKKKKLKSAMLLSVHDEIVFEVPPDELDMVCDLVKEIMENVWKLNVPLKVNVGVGENWAEAH